MLLGPEKVTLTPNPKVGPGDLESVRSELTSQLQSGFVVGKHLTFTV